VPESPARLLISCGEASGDLYAGQLLSRLRARYPSLACFGLGGDELAGQGAELLAHIRDLSVVGLVEVLSSLPRLHRVLRKVLARVDAARPDAAVLIDYSGFNLRLARELRRRGVPVLYYVSPQVWAWRRGRVETIRRTVDRMLVLFPFEVSLYEGAGVPVTFVGHPLVDVVRPAPDREAFLRSVGLDPSRPVAAILPGSRSQEISRILPTLLAATEVLARSHPQLQFALAGATSLSPGSLEAILGQRPMPVLRGQTHALVGAADVAILASGTATVETALLDTPMVVVYRVSRLSYLLGRAFVRVPHFAMVNLIAERRLVPELIQGNFTPERVAAEASRLLDDAGSAAAQRAGLALVRERLGAPGAADRAAQIVQSYLPGGGGGAAAPHVGAIGERPG